jgi:amidase
MRGHIPPPPEVLIPPQDLAVTGPLARSAADLKLALKIIGGPDPADAIAYSWNLPPSRGTRLSDYRIGYVLDDTLCPVNSDVKEVLTQAVKALRKTGVKLEEGWPSGVNPSEQYEIYRFLLISTEANKLRTKHLKKFREIAARKDGSEEARIAWAWTAPHKYFQAVSSARISTRAIWQDYFRTHDVFLLPTAFTSAFPHDHSQPFERRKFITEEGPRSYYDLSFWISFATLSGLPATTAPIGLTKDGLPVSIQIVGPYLEDATSIDFAGQMADVIGEFQPPKSYI